jgi:hypothetical protein
MGSWPVSGGSRGPGEFEHTGAHGFGNAFWGPGGRGQADSGQATSRQQTGNLEAMRYATDATQPGGPPQDGAGGLVLLGLLVALVLPVLPALLLLLALPVLLILLVLLVLQVLLVLVALLALLVLLVLLARRVPFSPVPYEGVARPWRYRLDNLQACIRSCGKESWGGSSTSTSSWY